MADREMISAHSRISFAREGSLGENPAAYGGTNGSTSARFLGITNQTVPLPDKDVDYQQYRSFGTGRDPAYITTQPGQETRQASIPYIPTSGETFFYALGADAASGTSPTTHTITPVEGALPPSLSLRCDLIRDTDENFRRTFSGCVINNLSCSLSNDSELQVTADIFAQTTQDHDADVTDANLEATATSLASPESKEPYMFFDFASNISINGNTYARVNNFDWSINNNISPHHFLQSSNAREPFTFLNSYPTYSLSLEIVPAGHLSADADAVYYLLEGETEFNVSIPLQRSASDTLQFDFTNCRVTSAPHDLNEDGGTVSTTVDCTFEDMTVTSKDSESSDYGSL